VREDLFDDRLFQDRRDDLELATAVRAVLQVEFEHPLEQPGPAQPHRSVAGAVRLALGRLCGLRRRLGLLGAAVGTVVGLFMGLVGVLFMPLVGAAVGEYLAQKDHARAAKVGMATWVGIMVGLITKVVLAFIMVGIFSAALLI
jgi:hypothetical protein